LHTSFKWANLASNNAGVTVVIIGLAMQDSGAKRLYESRDDSSVSIRNVSFINAYLVSAQNIIVEQAKKPLCSQAEMVRGNMPYDGGHLLLNHPDVAGLGLNEKLRNRLIRRIYGSAEFIRGVERYCIWISDNDFEDAIRFESIRAKVNAVREMRLSSSDRGANVLAGRAHQFREMNSATNHTLVMPRVSSEGRPYLPAGLLRKGAVATDLLYALYDAPFWTLALLTSQLHLTWIATICGQLETRFRYSNTLGWNTFPVPTLTEHNKADLTRCAEGILLAREAHFPATIADLYDPDAMPNDLRAAHDRNDETLERIYIGRRFRNDTERLEKLFDMYAKMTAARPSPDGRGDGGEGTLRSKGRRGQAKRAEGGT
jgi:hypothetical protein